MDGQIESIREQLEHEMDLASKGLNFEKAAQLRDAIASLEVSTQKQAILIEFPTVYPWRFIRRGRHGTIREDIRAFEASNSD